MGYIPSESHISKETISELGNLLNDLVNDKLVEYCYCQTLDKFQYFKIKIYSNEVKWWCQKYQQEAVTCYKSKRLTKTYFFLTKGLYEYFSYFSDEFNMCAIMIKYLYIEIIIDHSTGSYDEALNILNNPLELKLKKLSQQHESMANSRQHFWEIHLRQCENLNAMICSRRDLKNDQKLHKDQNATAVHNQAMNKINIAESNKDFAIASRCLDRKNHAILAESYGDQVDTCRYQSKCLIMPKELKKFIKPKLVPVSGKNSTFLQLYQYSELAAKCQRLGQYPKVLWEYERAINSRIVFHGMNHIEVANFYPDFKKAYQSPSYYNKALDMQSDIVGIMKAIYGESDRKVAECYQNMGILYILSSKLDDAIIMLIQAVNILSKKCPEDVVTAKVYIHLANAYYAQSKLHNAMMKLIEAVNILSEICPGDIITAKAYVQLANVYKAQSKDELAIRHYELAICICNKHRKEPLLATAMLGLLECTSRKNDQEDYTEKVARYHRVSAYFRNQKNSDTLKY